MIDPMSRAHCLDHVEEASEHILMVMSLVNTLQDCAGQLLCLLIKHQLTSSWCELCRRTGVSVCAHVCAHMCVLICVRSCVLSFVCVCACACARACLRDCVRACVSHVCQAHVTRYYA